MVEQSSSQDLPSDRPTHPARRVLEGVPRVGFGIGVDGPENVMFPACLRAALAYLGAGPTYDYTFLMGVSGTAFGLLWDAGRWGYNADIADLAPVWPDPILHAFEAIGHGCQIVSRAAGADEGMFRRSVVESIGERGVPVLAFGVVGPPCCGLVTGYDEKGDVLVGWSFFQSMPGHGEADEFEPGGYFRKRGWYADTPALILIAERRERAPLGAVYRRALAWAVELARTPTVAGRRQGLAAYEAWAADLLRDEDFPRGDLPVLLDRLDCHSGPLFIAGEGRHCAARFLRRIAEHEPKLADSLVPAAEAYDAEVGLIERIVKAQGGYSSHDEGIARRLAEPAIRRDIAGLVREAGRKEAEAIGLIERVL